MRYGRLLALALALVPTLLTATDAAAQVKRPEKASIEIALDRASYAPGGTARIAVVMHIEEEWHTNSHQPTFDYLIPTTASLELPEGWPAAEFQYPEGVLLDFSFTDEPISVYDGKVTLIAEIQVPAGAAAGSVAFTAGVHYQACNDSQCLAPVTSTAEAEIDIGSEGSPSYESWFAGGARLDRAEHGSLLTPIRAGGGSPPASTGSAPGDSAAGASTGISLFAVLLSAILGGLILNVMPCVLPVLSLKVFSLIKSADAGRSAVTSGTLMTSLGILCSFWALALAAVLARAAGQAAGWGVQFQEPGFVVFLVVIVVLFSLNMWGLFEVPLPAFLAQRLAGQGAQQGAAGHFASGLFATLMATPCSAPFLGTAVSFALSQSAARIFIVFTAIGVGMALPYLALAVFPAAAKWLPRPGAWMETVRGLMGFLLAAAALWLLYVLSIQISPESLAFVQLALLGLALFLWLRHRASFTSDALRAATLLGTLACAILAIFLAVTAAPAARASATGEGDIAWMDFDRSRAEALAAEGRMVFVDVTAAWCMTCKFNEKTVIETDEVINAFERHGVVPMKADWTNYDEGIRRFLEDHGRSGIPFYLLYRPGQEPHVFGEILTRGGLISVLEETG